MAPRMALATAALAVAALAAALCAPAQAARYHVRVGGTRQAGPSVPGVWDPVNCYGALAAGLAAAAAPDSVLLFEETHVLDDAATLTALLTNRHLEATAAGAEVALGPGGTLAVDPAAGVAEVRGLTFTGGEESRPVAAVTVPNASQLLQEVTLRGCRFASLRGGPGPALSTVGAGHGAALTLEACAFAGNQAAGHGGAVHVGGGWHATARDCDFTANRTTGTGQGGAVMVAATAAPSWLTLEDCTFDGNASAGPGGAINVDSASLVLRRCVVRGSRSAAAEGAYWKEGAGLRVTRSGGHTDPVSVLLEGCTFADNRGSDSDDNGAGDGGGALVKGGDTSRMTWAVVTGCLFEGNVNAQGAGLYLGRFCEGEVRYCAFVDNVAWYQGGGAFKGGELPECAGELAVFDYCEFRGNRAGFRPDGTQTQEYSRGGGVMVRLQPRAYLTNCSFADNRVNDQPYAIGDGFAKALEGGEWTDENRCRLVNCAFWGGGGDIQVRSEGTGGMDLVSHVAVPVGQLSVNGTVPIAIVWLTELPFQSLRFLRPASGSPLIDAGAPVPFDEDLAGLPVPAGDGYDIGCYEMHEGTSVDALPAWPPAGLAVSPNPFNPRTTFAFAVPVAAPARLVVFDARGARIRELLAGTLAAGPHAVAWDGRDDRGRAVAAGTYLARLQTPGREVTVKATLAR